MCFTVSEQWQTGLDHRRVHSWPTWPWTESPDIPPTMPKLSACTKAEPTKHCEGDESIYPPDPSLESQKGLRIGDNLRISVSELNFLFMPDLLIISLTYWLQESLQ